MKIILTSIFYFYQIILFKTNQTLKRKRKINKKRKKKIMEKQKTCLEYCNNYYNSRTDFDRFFIHMVLYLPIEIV